MNPTTIPLPRGLRFELGAAAAWRDGSDDVCVELLVALLRADARADDAGPAPLQLALARACLDVVETQVVGFVDRSADSTMSLFAAEVRAGTAAVRAALTATPPDVAALREVATLGDRTRAANRATMDRVSAPHWHGSTNALDAVSAVATVALAPAADLARWIFAVREHVWRAYGRSLPIVNLSRTLADSIRTHCRPDLERFDQPWGG